MRIFFIQILLILGSAYYTSQNESLPKCGEVPGEDVNSHIENAVQNFRNCFIAHVENFRHTVATNSCSETVLKIQECDNDIVKNITACNSPDGNYFPKSVFSVIGDYAGYICSDARRYKLPILLDHKTCFPLFANGVDCFHNFRFFNTTAVISKEEMCSDHKEVQDCLQEYANMTCPEDSVFLEIVNDTFKFDQPPCAAGTTVIEIYSIPFCILTMFIAFQDF